jgi:hypothetical protein
MVDISKIISDAMDLIHVEYSITRTQTGWVTSPVTTYDGDVRDILAVFDTEKIAYKLNLELISKDLEDSEMDLVKFSLTVLAPVE